MVVVAEKLLRFAFFPGGKEHWWMSKVHAANREDHLHGSTRTHHLHGNRPTIHSDDGINCISPNSPNL